MMQMSIEKFHELSGGVVGWKGRTGEDFPGKTLEHYTAHGDYVGGYIEAANYNVVTKIIDERFPDSKAFWDIYGMGSRGVGVHPDRLTDEEADWLEDIEAGLSTYPLLDDIEYNYLVDTDLNSAFEDIIEEIVSRGYTVANCKLSEVKMLILTEHLYCEEHINVWIDWDRVFKEMKERDWLG